MESDNHSPGKWASEAATLQPGQELVMDKSQMTWTHDVLTWANVCMLENDPDSRQGPDGQLYYLNVITNTKHKGLVPQLQADADLTNSSLFCCCFVESSKQSYCFGLSSSVDASTLTCRLS